MNDEGSTSGDPHRRGSSLGEVGSGGGARTSRLAVAAFVLGLVSFFLSAGMLAIALGIVSLRRIRRSGMGLKGREMAWGAIALPILMVPGMALLQEVGRTGEVPAELICQTNLSGLGKAMLLYMASNDEFPAPARWCDLLMRDSEVDPRTFRCRGVQRSGRRLLYPLEFYIWSRRAAPAQIGGPCDYGMNKYVEGFGYSAPADMVVLFDAKAGWNQAGGPELLTTDNHGGEGCNVVFVDSHTEFIKTENLSELRWKP